MISEELVSFRQNPVVEKIRKCSEGPVQTGFSGGPPVGMLKNQSEIFGRGIADAGIEQQDLVVENKSALKRI